MVAPAPHAKDCKEATAAEDRLVKEIKMLLTFKADEEAHVEAIGELVNAAVEDHEISNLPGVINRVMYRALFVKDA